MGAAVEKRRYTVAEYFALEETALERHEYRDGEILAMSGGTLEHSGIASNLIREIGNRLKGHPCRIYGSDLRIRVGRGTRYVYPDAQIICGEPQFDPDDERRTTVLNPRVVIEVLSDSTEGYDRGRKFSLYRDVPTMEEYVLVSQREPLVETYLRRGGGDWRIESFQGLAATLRLQTVGVELGLTDAYEGVVFPPDSSE